LTPCFGSLFNGPEQIINRSMPTIIKHFERIGLKPIRIAAAIFRGQPV
jgi:hypothetical protein